MRQGAPRCKYKTEVTAIEATLTPQTNFTYGPSSICIDIFWKISILNSLFFLDSEVGGPTCCMEAFYLALPDWDVFEKPDVKKNGRTICAHRPNHTCDGNKHVPTYAFETKELKLYMLGCPPTQ